MKMQDEPLNKIEEFIALLAQHDRGLTLYVVSLCPNVTESDDILQEVKLILWQKFDHFEKGTSFIAWARKIAFFKILSYRKQKSKNKILNDDSLLLEISDDQENRQQLWHKRGQALDSCVQKMTEEQQHVLQMRYKEQLDVESMAERLGRTQQAIYRQLSRLREQLLNCVKKHPILEEE
jgi:RNA polymerase sigma-70 factor (ECF subfamily)